MIAIKMCGVSVFPAIAILAIAILSGGGRAVSEASTSPTSTPTSSSTWLGLPMRTTVKPNSGAGDAVNVALEGSRTAVLADFAKIGWVQADPLSKKNDVHLAEAALHHGKYPKAPVSRQYLFGRLEDFAVEHELSSVSQRDHARFWDASKQDPNTHQEIWLGAASRDIGIKVLRRHKVLVGTTHRIDGHLDTERQLIVTEMQHSGVVKSVFMEPGVGKLTNARTGGGDLIFTDGKLAVIVLK